MMATWKAIMQTALRLVLVYREAPRCNVRSPLGMKRLALSSTLTCRADRSVAHRRGPVHATMDRVVVVVAGDAKVRSVAASVCDFVAHIVRQSRWCGSIFLSIAHELSFVLELIGTELNDVKSFVDPKLCSYLVGVEQRLRF